MTPEHLIFVHTLVRDAARTDGSPALSVVTHEGARCLRIDWAEAAAHSFYRTRGVSGAVTDEASSRWGDTLVLAAAITVGFFDATASAQRFRSVAPLVLGAPYSFNRRHWDWEGDYESRLRVVRRQLFRQLESQGDALDQIQRAIETLLSDQLRAVFPVQPRVTHVDLEELGALVAGVSFPSLPPVVSSPPPIRDEDERRGILQEYRTGCVARIPRHHNNYCVVKLSSYVRHQWDAREATSILDYRDTVGEISPETLAHGISAARRWLLEKWRPAGDLATRRVLEALDLPASEDLLVLSRAGTSGKVSAQARHRAHVHTVKIPEDLARHRPVKVMRAIGFRDHMFCCAADLDVEEATVRRHHYGMDLDSQKKMWLERDGIRYCRYDHLADVLPDPWSQWLLRSMAAPPKIWLEQQRRSSAGPDRLAGQRVRMVQPFTFEEDEAIYRVASPRGHSSDIDDLLAAMPHHSRARLIARRRLMLRLKQAGLPLGTPLTRELVLQRFGEIDAEHAARYRVLDS